MAVRTLTYKGKVFTRGATYASKSLEIALALCQEYDRQGIPSLLVEGKEMVSIWRGEAPANPASTVTNNASSPISPEDSPHKTQGSIPDPNPQPELAPTIEPPASKPSLQYRGQKITGQKITGLASQSSPTPETTQSQLKYRGQAVGSTTPIPDASPSRKLVVCIDDCKTIQSLVKRSLERVGYEVMGITDPATALTAIIRKKPDLILMDISMPDVDGYELCRMLRQSRKLSKVPVVMLTGREGMIDRMRSQLAGAAGYMTKPFKIEELLDMVHKQLYPGQPPKKSSGNPNPPLAWNRALASNPVAS